MRVVLLAAVSMVFAGAASAQIQIGRGKFEPQREPEPPCVESDVQPSKANKEFAENYNTSSLALRSGDWAGALEAAALARPHASDQRQSTAILLIEVAAYHELGTPAAREQILETALAAPCLPAALRRNYREMLDKLRASEAAPQRQ